MIDLRDIRMGPCVCANIEVLEVQICDSPAAVEMQVMGGRGMQSRGNHFCFGKTGAIAVHAFRRRPATKRYIQRTLSRFTFHKAPLSGSSRIAAAHDPWGSSAAPGRGN